MGSETAKLRETVASAAKEIFEAGLVEAGEGNLSGRVPGKDELVITPAFNDYKSLTADELVRVKFDGTKLSGGRDASSEYRLHAAVYKMRSRANYVIHTHSPHATMLSVARKNIPVILEEMLVFLGGEVKVSDYGQANTDEISEKSLDALGKSNAILIANHGVLVCGRTIEHAVKAAELVEKMAEVYAGAVEVGAIETIPKDKRGLFLEKFKKDFSTN